MAIDLWSKYCVTCASAFHIFPHLLIYVYKTCYMITVYIFSYIYMLMDLAGSLSLTDVLENLLPTHIQLQRPIDLC